MFLDDKPVREYPRDMPEDTIRYLQREERKQNQHVNVARSKANVKDTVMLMHQNMGKIAERGQKLDEIEDQVEDLLDESELFYHATLPRWKQYVLTWIPPRWWFPTWMQLYCCPCYQKRKKTKGLL